MSDERITLYTCRNGKSLCEDHYCFWASDKSEDENSEYGLEIEFTVNKNDAKHTHTFDGCVKEYYIENLNSVEWSEK